MHRTPLVSAHEELGARMVDFGGWYLPVQYEGILAEHTAVRERCGIFDTCHMGRIMVTGSGAADYLSATLTVDANAMADGRCRYGFMLNEDAGIIDDLIVYRIAADNFMLVINSATIEGDLAQLNKHLTAGAALEDLSGQLAKVDIQGPLSPEITSKILGADLTDLRYFHLLEIEFEGKKAIVSKTGYTGEVGFEVYLPTDLVVSLWEKALAAGTTPAGLGARDTLRLEAGLPLYGHEMTTDITPVEAGFMRYIDTSRSFVGANALNARVASVPSIGLIAFQMEGRQSARHGNKVMIGGKEAGSVTSGSFGPSLGYCIGFAYIQLDFLAESTTFEIDNGRKMLKASVAKSPFYTK